MGQIRVAVAVLAAMVGVTAIALGVRIATHDPTQRLTTDNTLIPEADAPHAQTGRSEPVTTETTFDLAVLVPPSTAAPVVANTPTTAPASSPAPGKATSVVRVDNASTTPVRLVLNDDSQHQAVVAPGDGVTWVVRASNAHPDNATLRVNGTNCGASWGGVNNIAPGREYHLEVKPSVGFCAGGQAMPVMALTDYTTGASKTIAGPVPDGARALVYVVNKYTAATKVTLDAVETIEWTMDAGAWGATQLVSTDVGQDDVASVAQASDPSCANRDDTTHFAAGHTYRIEVVAGSVRCATGTGPALAIYDLTASTTTILD